MERRGSKFNFSLGQKFGEWEIISIIPIVDKKSRYSYQCRCSCGKERYVDGSNLKRGISTNCGCSRYKNPSHNYKGLGDLSQKYFSRLRSGAESRDYEFDIDKEYLLSIFDGVCKLSGVEIKLNRNTEKQTASVDRIDSTKGYIKGNVQWIHKRLNWLKRSMSDEELISWCKLITEKNK